MTHKDLALQYFSEHLHCSQAVLAAFASDDILEDIISEFGDQ